jgi:indole-3-glycerol phosphate synthase
MAATYLDAIVEHHRARAASDRRDWRSRLDSLHYEGPSFLGALRRGATPYIKVIAEIKRRSPSKGWLAPNLDAAATAALYRDSGAVAVSVLTDQAHFAGDLEDLRRVARSVDLPLLRKDFTVCENDVLDAAEAGAGAVLLIVAALSDHELATFLDVAERVGIDTLVEVHDQAEVQRAMGVGARIIGVNQRNLHSFDVDSARAAALAGSLPRDCVAVCESGLQEVADVARAAASGFDAVLVGEAFVTSPDPAATLRAFTQVPSVPRG